MTTADPAEEAGRLIDSLLAELRDGPDPRAATAAEELTHCLVGLYGEGLARMAAMLGPERLAELCADPLVASLLLVHDLHPVPAEERIRRSLAGAGAELLGIDEAGVARLRLDAGAPGCGRSREAEIEAAVRRAAPEVAGVEVEAAARPLPLLQVSLRPGLQHSLDSRPPVSRQ